MKKTLFLYIVLFLGLLFLISIVPRFGFRQYYFLVPWHFRKPNIYSMILQVSDVTQEWQWKVVVRDEQPIQVRRLSGPEYESWFDEYGFTIEGVYKAGNSYCFKVFECLIKYDPIYSYPTVLAYPPKSIVIKEFQPCRTVDECLNPQ